MAHIIKDRVLEQSITAGLGAFTLAGAMLGYRAFASVCAVSDTVWYYIEAIDPLGKPSGAYEYGIGTYSGANTLTRTAVLGSSNGGSPVDFAAGTKLVGMGVLAPGPNAVNGHWRRAMGLPPRAADFGAAGDGVTDDLVPLTAFFNSAISNPGMWHELEDKTYACSGALPNINVSGVLIRGVFGANRGVGSLTGSVIKAITGNSGTMLTIAPIEGPSAQVLQGVKLLGVTFDCANIAAQGVVTKSMRECEAEFFVNDATTNGWVIDVATTLGEAPDLQRCLFRYIGRQVSAANGVSIRLKGTSVANISFNTFEYVDVVHTNASAIIEENADNNLWLHTRTFCSGTATNSIEWLGGASAAVACRDEHFVRLSTNKPAIAKGTGTYTAPATNIVIDNMDITNSSPTATEETGATIYDGKWRTYTPTLTAQAGVLSSASASLRYMRELRLMNWSCVVTAPDIGSASGGILATLPTAAANNTGSAGGGAGIVTATGVGVSAFINQGSSQVVFRKSGDGSFPLASGQTLVAYGSYETAQ